MDPVAEGAGGGLETKINWRKTREQPRGVAAPRFLVCPAAHVSNGFSCRMDLKDNLKPDDAVCLVR